jgi:hypothetical protein
MPAITIELDDGVRVKTCAQCGMQYPLVHGFLYRDGNAWAVYWAELYKDHPNHPEPRVVLIIALGDDWSEGADPAKRAWAQLEAWPHEDSDEIEMAFTDPQGSLDTTTFGRSLSREMVLTHPLKDLFLAAADEVIYRDTRVSALMGTRP